MATSLEKCSYGQQVQWAEPLRSLNRHCDKQARWVEPHSNTLVRGVQWEAYLDNEVEIVHAPVPYHLLCRHMVNGMLGKLRLARVS